VVLAVLFSAISAYFYLRVVRYMYMSEPLQERADALRCSPGMLTALTLCLLGVIGLGLFPGPLLGWTTWILQG
jgi:NADH-quinone oxidoreductase subunit N